MPSRRNATARIYLNGKAANGLQGLAARVGSTVSRYSVASQRAGASLKRRVLPAVKTAVRDVYTIKAGDLTNRVKLTGGSLKKGDYISIWASTRRMSLLAFGGRWTGVHSAGATAAIVKGQRKTYDHAFIANVGWRGMSGTTVKADTVSRGIYIRSRGPNGKPVARGPLRRLYGPSVFDMLSYNASNYHSANTPLNTVVPQLETFYVGELRRQIVLELRRG